MGHHGLRASARAQSRATCYKLSGCVSLVDSPISAELLTCFAEPCAGGGRRGQSEDQQLGEIELHLVDGGGDDKEERTKRRRGGDGEGLFKRNGARWPVAGW